MKKLFLIFISILISVVSFGQDVPFGSQIDYTKPYFQDDVKVKDTLFIENKAVQWNGSSWESVGGGKWSDAAVGIEYPGRVEMLSTVTDTIIIGADTITGFAEDAYSPLNFLLNSFVSSYNYTSAQQKIIPFAEKLLQTKTSTSPVNDVNILLLGDSQFGRSQNNTAYSTAIQKQRPPMMAKDNFASQLWDKINPGNQYYIRFDSSYFTETGTTTWTSYGLTTETTKAAWDDYDTRMATTREFSGTESASIQFTFDQGYNRINFIYRTSTEGCENLTILIKKSSIETIGKVEVHNGHGWVEANEYEFSQLYTDGGEAYGNTEYQRRLMFRKVAGYVGDDFDITITKPTTGSAESLMYWGVEFTPRYSFLTLRNAARGGHDVLELYDVLRTEIENFDVDLVLFQIPYLNMQASDGSKLNPVTMWTDTTYGMSAILKDTTYSLYNLSYRWRDFQVVCVPGIERQTWFNSDGTEIGQTRKLGGEPYFYSSDFYNEFQYRFLQEDSIGYINTWKLWQKASKSIYGDMYTALTASSASSKASFSEDGVHPNDYGCKAWVNFVEPLFDFTDNIKPVLADSTPAYEEIVYSNSGYISSKAEIAIPDIDTVNVTTALGVTWGGWFRQGSSSDNYALIRKPTQSGQDYITFRAYTSGGSQGNLRAQFYNWNGSSHTGKTVTKTGVAGVYDSTWVHIVGQVDIIQDSLRLFVDGVWVGSLKMSIATLYPNNTNDWIIRYPDVDRYGDFDELFITREILTYSQITELYGGGITNPGKLDELTGVDTDLIRAFYRFEEGTGTTVGNLSGADAGDLTISPTNQTWRNH